MGAKLETLKNNLPQLDRKLGQWQKNLPSAFKNWARDAAEEMQEHYLEHLEHQGRGGQPPPLSPITLHLYSIEGESNGEGIRNHLGIQDGESRIHVSSTFGVKAGRPTMIARIQDEGYSIPVTPKMRGWMAARGIFLRPTTQYITIPARYSWRHSVAKTNRSAKQKLVKRVKQVLT